MIRLADVKDVPRIVEMGSTSLREGEYRGVIADSPEVTAELAKRLLFMDNAKILVLELDGTLQGLFAFLLIPHYYSGEKCGVEIMWYVEQRARNGHNYGLELLWAAENMAAKWGAEKFQLTAPSDAMCEMYSKLRGYTKVETSFQRDISQRSQTCQLSAD